MTELDKLEQYLKEKKIPFDRIDRNGYPSNEHLNRSNKFGERHQIIVYDDYDNQLWDAICHYGSYGYEQGLIEIMGDLVKPEDGDSVVGYLTADDIIDRLKAQKQVALLNEAVDKPKEKEGEEKKDE